MKTLSIIAGVGILLIAGCATVKLQTPKEPMKIDITMRLDVYQHVQKDINDIENFVTGSDNPPVPTNVQSFLGRFTSIAYADDILSPEVEQAASRRKNRYAELIAMERAGKVGETSLGLVVVRVSADKGAEQLVREENSDRMIIYKEIALKNGTLVDNVQKLYAQRLQKDAPAGTPIQADSGEWRIK